MIAALPSSSTGVRHLRRPGRNAVQGWRRHAVRRHALHTADDHPAVAGGAWRSQAARSAARSSRSTVGDLAGMPLLISAPCSHCEQISTRGSDAAVAPTWPQCGKRFG